MSESIKEKNITTNRKARHDYHIVQTFEAGIMLVGTEVKALRQNKASLTDSYAKILNNEVWLLNANINVYDHGNINNHEPLRTRKLLLNSREIRKLKSYTEQKGYTLIALRLYFNNGKVKVELGVAKGKKEYDKRETIAKKDAARDYQRKIKL
ncbi:MAG: SsrA-binding protein SmpB [Melioribacteraceae bacterium]|nr:SsrA-binding protein SmpB [Melioribacteraceae bacterium]